MEPVAPPALAKGDTIAFVSTSARQHDTIPWRAERAAEFLTRAGYAVKIIHERHIPHSPLSANVAARVAELHAAFQDPAVKAIVCCIGGSTFNQLLPALDPEIVRNNPKIVTGSSDNTVLHHFCHSAGLRSFYGPSAITALGEWPEPLAFTWAHFVAMLTIPAPAGPMPRSAEFTEEVSNRRAEPEMIANGTMRARAMKPAGGWRWLKSGAAEGPIWGGCLPSLHQTMGTRWDVSYEGKIALIELPKNYGPELAICKLHDLRLRGILAQIVGLVVGRPHSYSPAEEQEWTQGIVRALEGHEIPVLYGVDVGHTDPMLTVPLGARMRLDQSRDLWEALESGVAPRVSTT